MIEEHDTSNANEREHIEQEGAGNEECYLMLCDKALEIEAAEVLEARNAINE